MKDGLFTQNPEYHQPSLFVADSEKKYYLIDGEFYTEDLEDPEDVCHISKRDFSEFEKITYSFLMLQEMESHHA